MLANFNNLSIITSFSSRYAHVTKGQMADSNHVVTGNESQ